MHGAQREAGGEDMSKAYPWIDCTVKIEHAGQPLDVTMRKPEGGSEWKFKTVRVPSLCDSDAPSLDIFDWLTVHTSAATMDEIEQIALRAVMGDEDERKEANEIDRYEEAHA